MTAPLAICFSLVKTTTRFEMAVCSLVIEKINIRTNGVTKPRIGRIIVGFEDQLTSTVSFDSKYVHYSPEDFVYNDFCFNYNGIDRNTISNQGERYSVVMDWVRAAIRGKTVVVCGRTDINEVMHDTQCNIVNLQDFFYNEKEGGIVEPVSLNRLCKRIFGYESHSIGRRDPFQECRFKVSLYHVMKGFKCGNILPPFRDSFFPKAQKIFFSAPPRKQAPEPTPREDWESESPLTRYDTANELRDPSVETISEDLRYVNLEEAMSAKPDKHESTSDSDWVPNSGARKKNADSCEQDMKTTRAGRGKLSCAHYCSKRNLHRKEDSVTHDCHDLRRKKMRFRMTKSLHAFIACAVDTTDHSKQPYA